MPGAKINGIKKVFSHPQALGQCEGYLNLYKNLEPTPYFDTAGSARFVSESKDMSQAAIASADAGRDYGLIAVAKAIEDNPHNFTRFIVIRKREDRGSAPKGLGKTSLVFALKNTPGALHKCLSVFAIRDIDLLKIESRPIQGSPWKYMFYLDIDGWHTDEKNARAIVHLEELTEHLSVLGSFARAEDR